MDAHLQFLPIYKLFQHAKENNRNYLFEYEVYDLIRYIGSENTPAYFVLPKNACLEKEHLWEFPGERIVIKIVSSYIFHKSDVGGVRICNNNAKDVLSTVNCMYHEVPTAFIKKLQCGSIPVPDSLQDVSGRQLRDAVAGSIEGVVLCEYMPSDSHEFGNELLVSLRRTREFGMMLSAGLGGTDTELYAKRFRKGQAVVSSSTEMVGGNRFFHLFKKTISYKKLAGLTRGQKRIVTDEQLQECFSAILKLGNYFSPLNPLAPYVIDELEINPFAFSNYCMLPLDGLCHFSLPKEKKQQFPIYKINHLLHPQRIGIVGVSSRGKNIGKIIMENVLRMGFPKKMLTLVHPTALEIDNIATCPDIHSIPQKLDILILSVSGEAIPEIIAGILKEEVTESVVLIPAGFGETVDQEGLLVKIQKNIAKSREQNNTAPILLGGNSLGILSHPGKYDSLFIPESKLPRKKGNYTRRSAFVSQSGAYMITRMSKLSFLDPAYAVSIGNQIDLKAGDLLHFFKNINELDTIAFYMEGFGDLDGLSFSQAVRETVCHGKEIIFYKAGRTPEGKTATSGHTSSIAGDYIVCESCISQAGAFVAETFAEFEGLLRLSRSLHGKSIKGNRLAAVSNAGYESVGIADNILGEDYSLTLAKFQDKTVSVLEKIITDAGLSSLANIVNPMDVTPMATEEVYASIISSLLKDEQVDVVIVAIVPLTPILHTLHDELVADDPLTADYDIVGKINELNKQTEKPLVIVVDSGSLYDHMANGLEENGLPVFRSADQAVRVLGKYVQTRCWISRINRVNA